MHTNAQPIPASAFFFELDGQRHDLVVPLLEGAAPLADDPPCSSCGSCDPHRFGRDCGHRWPIQQGKAA